MIVNDKLLRTFVRLVLCEADLARVPNQLMTPGESDAADQDGTEETIGEFSGAGAAMGCIAPLGASTQKKKTAR